MSRKSCIYCVLKHIAQASILLDESKLGYPFHKWYAVGHLAEAESESRANWPELSKSIRDFRLEIMKVDKEPGWEEPSSDLLIMEACTYGDIGNLKDDIVLDNERNSKQIIIKDGKLLKEDTRKNKTNKK
jgi:hypothetical protein